MAPGAIKGRLNRVVAVRLVLAASRRIRWRKTVQSGNWAEDGAAGMKNR
jgi:hypothetical protein